MESTFELGKGLGGLWKFPPVFGFANSLNGHLQHFCFAIPFVARDKAMGGNLETVKEFAWLGSAPPICRLNY